MRLICIPFAGGGASAFRPWGAALSARLEVVAVQPPGRESRFREAPLRDIATIVEQLGTALAAGLDRPFALFGHSMGALVAFELARWLRRQGLPLPRHLILSGRRAASLPLDRRPYHDLPDADLLDEIRRMRGTDDGLLQNDELMALLLPTIRADFAAHDTYRYRPEPPLPVPLSIFGGRDDVTTPPETVAAWAEHGTAGARVHLFDGGHFFINDARAAVLRTIEDELAAAGHIRRSEDLVM
ncbi:thioesterase II family protein [Pseudoduganella flava]|uniref:thioesterase II family protein n=1 Tax=Pseudoduganella flava TaxID=871742 RepID=UPI0013038603|nr:alpha/beta fold hydrolase [Pseudoduganella flava]